jgi:hypothetical protein
MADLVTNLESLEEIRDASLRGIPICASDPFTLLLCILAPRDPLLGTC